MARLRSTVRELEVALMRFCFEKLGAQANLKFGLLVFLICLSMHHEPVRCSPARRALNTAALPYLPAVA